MTFRTLFRTSKPRARLYSDADAGLLWAAYKGGAFRELKRELTQEEFALFLQGLASQGQACWVLEDRSSAYKDGWGPVCLATVIQDGWTAVVSGEPFPWASCRNRLRCAVYFLSKLKRARKLGVIFTKTSEDQKRAYKHLAAYDLLYLVGKVGENVLLYSMRGRGSE